MKTANEALELTNQRVEDIHRAQQIKNANEWKNTLKTVKADMQLFMDNILSPAIDKAIADGSYDLVICISKYNMRPYDTYNHYVHGTLSFEEYDDKKVVAFVDMLANTLSEDYQYTVMIRKNSTDILDPKLDTDDDYYAISVRWSEVNDEDYDLFDNDWNMKD
jgi:hypothetical protein